MGELHPLETPGERWDKISVDFITELPDAHGYDAIMNVVDSVGKRAHFLPTHTTITVEGAANLYFREIWKHHGLPRAVVSDRGSQFVAEFMRELYRLLDIRLATSTAYHPQTDGQTEQANQELEHVRGPPVFLYSIHIYIYTTYLHLITSATASTTLDNTRQHSTTLDDLRSRSRPHFLIIL